MGGSGKKTFSGLGDCIMKTMKGPGGFLALYTGFGVSVVGIVGYRGLQLGCFDTITGLNPYQSDRGVLGAVTTFAAAQTRRASLQVCTRGSWQMSSAASVELLCWCSMTGPRMPWASEVGIDGGKA